MDQTLSTCSMISSEELVSANLTIAIYLSFRISICIFILISHGKLLRMFILYFFICHLLTDALNKQRTKYAACRTKGHMVKNRNPEAFKRRIPYGVPCDG